MPMAYARANEIARELRDTADEARALLSRIDQILDVNSAAAINWTADPKPAFLTEDADGNLDGLVFSRTDLSNAIFSLDQIRKVLRNQAVSQGDHLGNLLKLTTVRPVG
jgi:hypothetical protein